MDSQGLYFAWDSQLIFQVPRSHAKASGVSFSGLAALAQSIFSIAGERLVLRLRQQVFRSLLSQETQFFDEHLSGELVTRLAADTQVVQTAATDHLPLFLTNAATFFGGMFICLATSWQLFCMILTVAPFVGLVAHPLGRMMEHLSTEYQEALAFCGVIASETFSSIRTVRLFACGEAKQQHKYVSQLTQTYKLGRRRARILGFLVLGIGALVQASIIGSLDLFK